MFGVSEVEEKFGEVQNSEVSVSKHIKWHIEQ